MVYDLGGKMRIYIRVWIVIALIINIASFSFLLDNSRGIFRCNRKYKRIYPSETSNEVVHEIDDNRILNGRKPSAFYKNIPDDDHPLHETERLYSDMVIIWEIMGALNIVLLGTAVLLYPILSGIKRKKKVRAVVFAVCLVVFLSGSGYAGYRMYRHIRTPADIHDVYFN